MSRQTFQRQILFGYGVAMALTVLVLAWGLINLSRLGQASDAILRENYRSILAAEKMRDAIQRQESATVFLLVENERDVVQPQQDHLGTLGADDFHAQYRLAEFLSLAFTKGRYLPVDAIARDRP